MNPNDTSGVLAVLAAALAPYLVQHMGAAGANPAAQQGGTFGSPQTGGAPNTNPAGTLAPQTGGALAAAGANPFGTPQQAQQPQQPQVTPDMIQNIVAPLVQNEQVKAHCIAQMQEMGIQNLPDARPDQLDELYRRFQTIDKQAREAGLIGGAAAAAPSLI